MKSSDACGPFWKYASQQWPVGEMMRRAHRPLDHKAPFVLVPIHAITLQAAHQMGQWQGLKPVQTPMHG